MKPRTSTTARPRSKGQLLVDAASKRAKSLHAQGRYEQALEVCLQTVRRQPRLAAAWSDAAVNCIKLERWTDAIRHAQTALACGGDSLALYDALSHAHGALKQWDEVRRYGLYALNLRDRRFGGVPPMPHEPSPDMPPLPSPETRERNVISFSLFGGDSKYGETAVLNVVEQPRAYPHWVCRFYIDDSVPAAIVDRLRNGGAQIVRISGDHAQWPGTMWRFLALDDPRVDRVLFRDADSVISNREAEAVDQWLHSGKRFHAMRDSGTHTELLLAGLWGAVRGALPPIDTLVRHFMRTPLESAHFADQYFLRQSVWPYARASLMQHDSMFGFLDAHAFPGGPMPDDFHVGYSEGSPYFTAASALPDGSAVEWKLYRTRGTGAHTDAQLVCAYPARVAGGAIRAHVPARYARWIDEGSAYIRVMADAEVSA
ncbi:hypothetical protein C7405_1285 [Paraburkholderia caballeronis]|nr:hypothetical protein C7405_1285 [Paraburkholderia caballeronis]